MWQIENAKKDNEKLTVTGFRLWYERMRLDPSNKPFAKYSVLLLEKDKSKKDSYRRLIKAGGGSCVEIGEIGMANLIICDKNEVPKRVPPSAHSNIPIREAVFLNDVLLKDATLDSEV